MPPLSSTDILNLGFDTTANAHKVLLVNSSGTVLKNSLQVENRLGSECSGSDGALGRVLTLQNTSESAGPTAVWVEDQLIDPGDVTYSHLSSSSTLTFDNITIFDADTIIVNYYI